MQHITHTEGFEFAKNLSRFYECMHADAQNLISTLRGFLNAGMLQKTFENNFVKQYESHFYRHLENFLNFSQLP